MPGIQSFRKIGLDVELCQRCMVEVAPARETSCWPVCDVGEIKKIGFLILFSS